MLLFQACNATYASAQSTEEREGQLYRSRRNVAMAGILREIFARDDEEKLLRVVRELLLSMSQRRATVNVTCVTDLKFQMTTTAIRANAIIVHFLNLITTSNKSTNIYF